MNTSASQRFHIPVLAIVGVGMIGGSLSLALKKQRRVGRVVGVGRSRENLDKALEIGAIDEVVIDAATAASMADVILLATPVGVMEEILHQILPHIDETKIVTDVGSVKGPVVEQAMNILGDQFSRFVPGHPVAGKEHSGAAAASADLYEKHTVAVTPHVRTDPAALATIEKMWRVVGGLVVQLDPEQHDRVLGITSHLPHVLAYAMVHYFAGSEDREKCYQMAGGGFYDFTRLASSDPVMWRDICRMNKTEVLNHIQGFRDKLGSITALLENGNDIEIERLFRDAREARELVTEKRKHQQSEDGKVVRQRVQQQVNR